MDEIVRRFPTLSLDHVRELAAIVACERNAVAVSNQVYRGARWGLACFACEIVKNKIEEVAELGDRPWLRYVRETGMAYTVVVDGVPMRIQPDVDDIRDMMPGERVAMLRVQMSLLAEADPEAILRLEVAQRSGEPVDLVTLYLFNERTGVTLDSQVVYRAEAGTGTAPAPAGTLVPLARPPQDVDPTMQFEFDDIAEATANDNGRDE